MIDKPLEGDTPNTDADKLTSSLYSDCDLSRPHNSAAVESMRSAASTDHPHSSEAGRPATEKEINHLLQDLGSDKFQIRENASRNLTLFGDLAVPQLLKTLNETTDPEVRARTRRILNENIDDKIQRNAAEEKVHLLKDVFEMEPGGPVKGPVTDETLRVLADPKTFEAGNLSANEIPAIEHLMKMPGLDEQKKVQLQFAIDCIKSPEKMAQRIETLNLQNSDVTDAGIDHIVRAMPNVKTIMMPANKNVSDRALTKLLALPKLATIDINGKFTDQGLIDFVTKSKTLKYLGLERRYPNVEAELQRIAPGLKITLGFFLITRKETDMGLQLRRSSNR
jgi:hypothetical protein